MGKNLRRLIQPEVTDQLGHLFRVFQPRGLPGGLGHQIGFPAQTGGDGLGGGFCGLGVGAVDCQDQFAGVGKMLLVNLQALHGRNVSGQKAEHVGIEMETGESRRHREEQRQPPPMEPTRPHGKNWPSRYSPVPAFSSRQELSALRVNFHGASAGLPARTRAS